jgi:hypothetical protein
MRRSAIDPLTPTIANGLITLQFSSGPRFEEKLPSKGDRGAISALRDKIEAFGLEHDATRGQINAAFKALTSNGYHVHGPRPRHRPLTEAEKRQKVREILAQYSEEEQRQIRKAYGVR